MTNEEREKKTKIANMLIETIKDLRTPMLMYQVEKDVTKEALENYIKALEQEPCEDAISRKAVLDMATSYYTDGWDTTPLVVDVEDIEELPSVTLQPKTGRWINLEKTKYKGQVLPFWCRYGCSKCGGHGEETFNYCPNCGADMRESEDKE